MIPFVRGQGFTWDVPLIKAGSQNFAGASDYTPVAADVQICKDGGARANLTALITAVVYGNGQAWRITVSNAEADCARMAISIIDAPAKAVEDVMLLFVARQITVETQVYPGQIGATLNFRSPFFRVYDALTGAPVTGLVDTDFTCSQSLNRRAGTAVPLVALALITSPYSSGGVKERDPLKHPGEYRFDPPTLGNEVGEQVFEFQSPKGIVTPIRFDLVPEDYYAANGSALEATLLLVKNKTDQLQFTDAGLVDAGVLKIHHVDVNGAGVLGNEWGA